MRKCVKLYFWGLFLCPENVLTFLGGIFVAVSVNILTSQIPNSVLCLGWTYIFVALLFFLIAVILLWWSILIKPLQVEYNESTDIKKRLGDLECWYNIINKNTKKAKAIKKELLIFFIIVVVLLVICIILLFFSAELNYCVNYIYGILTKE